VDNTLNAEASAAGEEFGEADAVDRRTPQHLPTTLPTETLLVRPKSRLPHLLD
jgi:hypothetical protein